MRADPKPNDFIPFIHSERTIVQADPDGIYRLVRMDVFEPQAWMVRVKREEFVGAFSLALD